MLDQVVKLANQMQPNFFDATESQFVFDNDDKDAALLGEGAFGKTYKMRNKIDDQIYAVKMIKVKKKERQKERPAASLSTPSDALSLEK